MVWIDAHGDLDTPASSPSGNEWGMPLRLLLDAGTVAAADAALVGARNLDPLDPGAGIPVFMPEPGGLSLGELERLLARIAAARPPAGTGLTGLADDPGGLPALARVRAALGL